MTATTQFKLVTAQWMLLDKIYKAVILNVETYNANKLATQKLTVTARVHHGDEFDVYSQPIGAFAASRTRVKWITANHISITRYVGPDEHEPDSIELLDCETSATGEKALRNDGIQDVAARIVEKSK